MKLKFTGTFVELKEKLSSLGGEWNEDQHQKKILRLNGGILNWFETTGRLFVQGREPGKSQLEQESPHLLYPEEFEKTTTPVATAVAQPVEAAVTRPSSIEHTYLNGEFTQTEIFIGIVSAVGTESRQVLDTLSDRLRGFGYITKEIRISSILPTTQDGLGEHERIKHYIEAGDKLRKDSGDNSILAAGASEQIKNSRGTDGVSKTAYIINSLKHPDEVELLRKIYGSGFYLLGIHADEKRRHDYLVNDKSILQANAEELIRIDEDENVSHGQRTRDTFHMSDLYVNLGDSTIKVKNTLQRFLELLFSHPYKNPTFDEFAMFMAFNSSVRSSDLSRQVGAVIARSQQIIATGANDCPKHGGGQYWAELDPVSGEVKDSQDGKDYTREEDSNKAAQTEIIDEIVSSVLKDAPETDESKIRNILKKSKISDLTEFGRVVHAEMEAILSCAREGINTRDTTLYCTTFPCHNCAKHIIDAGITRVVYVEPYPKSRALDLHSESIELKTSVDQPADANHVTFEPFTGVGARRFLDLFSMNLGSGQKLKRKNKDGSTLDWSKESSTIRTPLLPKSYLEVEEAAVTVWNQATTT